MQCKGTSVFFNVAYHQQPTFTSSKPSIFLVLCILCFICVLYEEPLLLVFLHLHHCRGHLSNWIQRPSWSSCMWFWFSWSQIILRQLFSHILIIIVASNLIQNSKPLVLLNFLVSHHCVFKFFCFTSLWLWVSWFHIMIIIVVYS